MSTVDIIINDCAWNVIQIESASITKAIIQHLKLDTETNFSLLLTNDEEITVFNTTYRQKENPTNVLSFPCEGIEGYIGDIILSYDTIKKESEDQNKSFTDHLTHMIVHGVLHLLGYDHREDEDANIMESHERAILSSLKIKNPYDA